MTKRRRFGFFFRRNIALRLAAVYAVLLIVLGGVSCRLPFQTDNRIKISFWHGMESGVNNRVLEAKINRFNQLHPDIFIDAQIYGAADQLSPKLDAAVAGKVPPDLIWWAPAYFPKYAEVGALRSLDDFIAADRDFKRDDIYDALWEMSSFERHIYATPFSANNLAIYYNRRAFAESGVKENLETWDDFKAAMQGLARNGKYAFQIPIGTTEWTVWTWECFLWQSGGEILSSDKRFAAFNSPAGISALEFWKSLLDENLASFSETDAGYKPDQFLAGQIPMLINGPWNYPALKTQKNIDVGVFALPGKERLATNIGGESLFLFKSSPERERAAWEFMKYVMSADFQTDWAIQTGYLPVSKSSAESPEYQAFLRDNPFMKVYNDQMKVGKTRPSVPSYPAISATLGKYLEAALYGKYSPKEALDRAAEEVNRTLRESERTEPF